MTKLRSQKRIDLIVALSGIAAVILPGISTTFKLQLDLNRDEIPMCNITKNYLIVWDECSVNHKRAFEALDRTVRNIGNNDSVMAGLPMVLSGDFRQIYPLIPKEKIQAPLI